MSLHPPYTSSKRSQVFPRRPEAVRKDLTRRKIRDLEPLLQIQSSEFLPLVPFSPEAGPVLTFPVACDEGSGFEPLTSEEGTTQKV
jgi:hypothetical protein